MTTKQTLLAAARLLERKGWCRHVYEYRGRHCLQGAIYAVTLVSDYAIGVMRQHGYGLDWNDTVAKNGRAVTTALRKVARTL